jgi:glycerol-3-phosphate cytidylyltransferase
MKVNNMKKYKVGYTTGVFDLFHVGHLNILKKSKDQCDFLIVGVTLDKLVKTYKNKSPIIPYEQRVEIVKSIRYVDRVVPQVSMDKYLAWKRYNFDIIFHGDDWKGTQMYNDVERKLRNVGVEFVYFSYTKVTSSTQIRQKITKKP